MLARLLHLQGIRNNHHRESKPRLHENRIRAGLIEHWAADLLTEVGVGARMQREGMLHWGINIGINGNLHAWFQGAGQQARYHLRTTGSGEDLGAKALRWRATVVRGRYVTVHDLKLQGRIRFTHQGRPQEIDCDFIAGCDGFHGICRPSFPESVLSVFEREYPFGWLGILSESPPPDHELIYSYTDRGFALYTMRSPTLARLYLQCDHDRKSKLVGCARLGELHKRLGGGGLPRARCCKGHHADAQFCG
jgi:p-hydroxybenzoate 3-monooxygenase